MECQGVDEACSHRQHGCDIESLFPVVHITLQQVPQRVVRGTDDSVHRMDAAVEQGNIVVAFVHRSIVYQVQILVLIFVGLMNHETAVIHVGPGDFCILQDGERGGEVSHVVASVDDAVVGDDLADGVECQAVAEAVPAGRVDDVACC